MRILPNLCFECGSWYQPKSIRKQLHCCNACRQSSYRRKGAPPITIKFYFDENDGGKDQAKFFKVLDTYKTGNEKNRLDIDNQVFALREDNWHLYTRFIYNYARDKFGKSASEFVNGDKVELL